MNILFLYNATQTFTNTVFEHAASFGKYSKHKYFYCHHDQQQDFNIDLSNFDAIAIHYSVRLPYDQISPSAGHAIERYNGLKFLFIQDEYDHTHRTWQWIKRLGFNLVFTVVPDGNISRVYPPEEFPGVRFVSNLTGYVPEHIADLGQITPAENRELIIGYRGRPLHLRYGTLGHEKVEIGRLVKGYCEKHNIKHDISWSEGNRIYGSKWYEFIGSCRGMLGSESGSNVFDWDGKLTDRIDEYRAEHPHADDEEVYKAVVAPLAMDGLMNQVSPRVFESITMKTVLIQFEGDYSGVLDSGRHYIELKKDGSNLDQVMEKLGDSAFVSRLVQQAYEDIIESGRYSYQAFVKMVDDEVSYSIKSVDRKPEVQVAYDVPPMVLTTYPARNNVCSLSNVAQYSTKRLFALLLHRIWARCPGWLHHLLHPAVSYFKSILRRGA